MDIQAPVAHDTTTVDFMHESENESWAVLRSCCAAAAGNRVHWQVGQRV
jgi:hypothetical protein